MTQPPPTTSPPRPGISDPDLLVALVLTALGVALLLGSFQVPFGINAVVGPRVFPLIVSVGLTVLGVLLTISVLRGDRAEPAAEEDTDLSVPVNLAAPGLILGGFLLGAAVLTWAGFVIGTAIMYFSVAWAFGERRIGLMAGVALAVALITYLAFTRGLGLNLPAGFFKGLL